MLVFIQYESTERNWNKFRNRICIKNCQVILILICMGSVQSLHYRKKYSNYRDYPKLSKK